MLIIGLAVALTCYISHSEKWQIATHRGAETTEPILMKLCAGLHPA